MTPKPICSACRPRCCGPTARSRREVARAMAQGALAHSRAELAVAVTGIAGPGGGSAEKPVGLVHLATARRDGEIVAKQCRFGDIGREQVRLLTVAEALRMLRAAL